MFFAKYYYPGQIWPKLLEFFPNKKKNLHKKEMFCIGEWEIIPNHSSNHNQIDLKRNKKYLSGREEGGEQFG